ncbi:alpha-ketoacid dehydrogenase subunit beta [Variovorax sp. Sphag1AA]|uniref:alpha-ketoacid dehydrogenase subunit beta n=1 Tax=Variovorax sp. Sphag1AA TaxID=2587027 RepID=UPI00160CF794|nr:transketolase C-terminal domain-containing protein [Variovorax sp. Sphag1AA]MBB3179972.1 pyruvate dehydrogenase E1 component beta subunit [Variovorax sp. Sphag1AA]
MIELSYSEAAMLAVRHEMEADARVVVLGEDVGRGGIFGQYKGLQETFGSERVIDTPISEAAIMGAGVGMALAGLRPVVEMRVVDFALCGMDELVNQAAKNRFMFGGQGRVPLVARMPGGIWDASAAQHSQSLEAWFAHLPGVVVVCPSTPQDNYSLMRAALRCGDPVVYIEHKTLWGARGLVDPSLEIPLGKSAHVRRGNALTMVSWSRQMHACIAACDALAAEGIDVDLIDLRTLWPWDREAVLASCERTGRLLVVHEAVQAAGFGAEIAATAAEATGCRVARLGAPRIPVGYAPVLEAQSRVSAEQIAQAARTLRG